VSGGALKEAAAKLGSLDSKQSGHNSDHTQPQQAKASGQIERFAKGAVEAPSLNAPLAR
jgi:hypothetical protein